MTKAKGMRMGYIYVMTNKSYSDNHISKNKNSGKTFPGKTADDVWRT